MSKETVRQQILRQTIGALIRVWGIPSVLDAFSEAVEDEDCKRMLKAASAAEREAIMADPSHACAP